ncbi:hypothetical protein N7490_004344 [Penicillium lividum]|nr:hypothetical protein N7490_004344 [Penicillium lividum]
MFKQISLRVVRVCHPLYRAGIDNARLSLFHQSTSAATESQFRILPLIKREHAELQSSSHKILNSLHSDEQTRYQNQFTWELARHTIGEELLVYPAIVQYVHNGQAIADNNRFEHQEIKEQLKMFQGLSCNDPRFAPTLEALVEDLEKHIRREEDVDFVLLEEALSRKDSEALARSLNRMKKFLPSRPHPLAPSKQPFETAVGLLTAPVDKIADLFRKWPHEDTGKRNEHLAATR